MSALTYRTLSSKTNIGARRSCLSCLGPILGIVIGLTVVRGIGVNTTHSLLGEHFFSLSVLLLRCLQLRSHIQLAWNLKIIIIWSFVKTLIVHFVSCVRWDLIAVHMRIASRIFGLWIKEHATLLVNINGLINSNLVSLRSSLGKRDSDNIIFALIISLTRFYSIIGNVKASLLWNVLKIKWA